jgi:hypothetical protein
MPVLSLKRRATQSAAHDDLSARLRRRSAREELAIPGKTTVLIRSAAPSPASPRPEAMELEQSVTSRAAWPTPAPSPVNVEALTSQVIQQIDRRLLAYRERMGRV